MLLVASWTFLAFVRNCDGFFIWQPHSFAQDFFDCFGMWEFSGGKAAGPSNPRRHVP